MASPFASLSGRKRDAESAMLDAVEAPMGSLQAEVLAAAAVSNMSHQQQLQHEQLNDQENVSLAHQSAPDAPQHAKAGKSAASKSRGASAGPLVAPLETLIPVPELETTEFDSWEDFHAALAAYGERTHQLYSVRSATPAARRNQLLAKKRPARAQQQQQQQQLIPERFHHYVKTITCTHGGKPRHRSTGARPNHHHRAIQCPAQVCSSSSAEACTTVMACSCVVPVLSVVVSRLTRA